MLTGALPEKGYTSPLDFESSIFNKKEFAMFITSQALTDPIAGYCVFFDIKNPLSKFLWTVDIWCTSRDSNPGPAD